MQRPPLPLMLAALMLALGVGLWTGSTLTDHGAVAWAMDALAAPLPASAPAVSTAPPPETVPGTVPGSASGTASPKKPGPAVPAKSATAAKSAPKNALPGLVSTTPAFRDPGTAPAAGPAAASAPGRVYTVQIASFKDPRRAGMMAAALSDQGLSSGVLRTQGKSGAVWYAVRAGELATAAEARELARSAQGLTGQPTLVRRLSPAFLARNTVHPAQELTQATPQAPGQTVAQAATPAPQAATRPKPEKPAQARPEISAQAKAQGSSAKKIKHPAQAQTAPRAPAAEAARPVEERLAQAGVELVLTRDRSTSELSSGTQPAAPAAAQAPVQPQASDWVYAVQAAGFNEPGEAQDLARTLAGLGMDTSISYLHGWYVVGAGAFPEREAAKARADAVRAATGREPTIHAASRRTLARSLWTPDTADRPDSPATPEGQEASLAPGPTAALPSQGASRELMYQVENWGRPDLTGTALVASYRDPREAGGMARQLKNQGVAAMVVYAAGPEPWGVYRKNP